MTVARSSADVRLCEYKNDKCTGACNEYKMNSEDETVDVAGSTTFGLEVREVLRVLICLKYACSSYFVDILPHRAIV